jgi:xanthine/CO dehydrogenase XdhC/CoxF family maturation factor
MLIDAEGRYHGMLSGGCLEGDLAIRAGSVLDSGAATTVVYDLASDDELWGLGVGCEGRLEVLLCRLSAERGYEPFSTMADVFESREPARMAIVVGDESALGGTATAEIRDAAGKTLYSAGRPELLDATAAHGTRRDVGGADVLTLELRPVPSILVLGAGPDVVPVVRFMNELGWRSTVADHRPAYVDNPLLGIADERHCLPSAGIPEAFDLDRFDAALVMSHHLPSDRDYLGALAASSVGYVGLLGPAARRDRLLADLGEAGKSLVGRLEGPAGLDIGGRGAAAIALSLVAGLQGYLSGRRGDSD